ncbi:MAG: right-handed parallel beta-helix repeat-containing protein [Streptosporangiaceae bacterium]
MAGQLAAFMSYARFDDQHDDGQLTAFRERLAAEVRVQTGEEFLIFQDRADIAWGQNWQQRISQALDTVTLLLVIITPGFFRSPHCRAETEQFLDRERQLGRDDLILPVYYVSTPQIDDPGRRDTDPLANALAARQHADWRELRFEPATSPVARRAIAHLATRMRDTFWRTPASTPVPARTPPADLAGPPALQAPHAAAARSAARTEPPTHVVDPFHRGDFTTISEAIKTARPGDRILVRPGLYPESLVIDKPLEILGDGPAADIQVHARDAHVVVFRANISRITNLTLRQVGGEGTWYGVDIGQGRLELEGCDITSHSGPCVAIHGGADPRLHRNTIHDGKNVGVAVWDQGLGVLEDNDITANADAGVAIGTGGNPTLRRNTIHDGKHVGVWVWDQGLGILEDNDITANADAGVAIQTGGNPTLRRNRINRNEYHAVRIYLGGKGVVEDNDLTGNKQGAWDIAADSRRNVTRARNRE